MACTGNSAEICGGAGRINIFNNTAVSHQPPPTAPTPTIKQTVGIFEYKGCFEDGVNGAPRSLQTQISVAGGVSAETCTTACKAAGFPLAGLEFGQECWCDNYMPLVINTPNSQCNMPCQNDNTEVCGAGNRLAVYQDTSATPPAAGVCLTNVAQFNNPNSPYMFNLTAVPIPGGGVGSQVGIFNLGVDKFQGPYTMYELEVGASQARTQHIFNFAVDTFWPSSIGFGVPATFVLADDDEQYFKSLSGTTYDPYRNYCVMPNPVGQFGPFIGPGTLAANGHNDLWALCPPSGPTADLIYNPFWTGSPPGACQYVVLQMDAL
ncbi:hypothetical protein D9619_009963 [Psilocybe cf. subviscida]|uniref:WSC domain-containing protein n=1 Tax=Psilocybe cf. subviscida TaxID=2480587 RepID=A0A8H5F644_9AGAR|nr:hypothetical protein D9619_009963 [Psilocybe cf. subviscida]